MTVFLGNDDLPETCTATEDDLAELRRHICRAIGALGSTGHGKGALMRKATDHLQNALDVLDAMTEDE